jgi:hypothetical protein
MRLFSGADLIVFLLIALVVLAVVVSQFHIAF